MNDLEPGARDPAGTDTDGRRGFPPVAVHLFVPACLSALLLLVSLPLILRLNSETFRAATGDSVNPYLPRWLALSAALFLLSGLLYAWRIARERQAERQRQDMAAASNGE